MHTSALLGLLALSTSVSGNLIGPGSRSSVQNFKNKIKNVVVLVMENRSLDNLLGGQTIKGLDNPINNGPFCNPLNISHPLKGQACSGASDYNSVIDDPDHAIYGNNFEFFGDFTPESTFLPPSMKGFVHEQIRSYGNKANSTFLAQQVMNYYTEQQVSVLTALTNNFVVFNHWHSDIPGPTNPNRVALHSGTSNGHGANDFEYGTMPQRSIFQQLSETNHTWKNYVTDSSEEDALWFSWTHDSNNTDLVQPIANYYSDAKAGKLPEFTVVGPSCCSVGTNSMHPQGLVSDGEQLIKDVYEALRASPQWDESLLLITFDETGGFHDHVPPPNAVRPDQYTYTATTPNGEKYTFEFDRLGGRLPTWVISPWVQQGFVEQQGINSDGQIVSYSASSMLRTLGYLWDFEPFNPRVEKAPSFDGLVQHTKQRSTPMTLPEVHPW